MPNFFLYYSWAYKNCRNIGLDDEIAYLSILRYNPLRYNVNLLTCIWYFVQQERKYNSPSFSEEFDSTGYRNGVSRDFQLENLSLTFVDGMVEHASSAKDTQLPSCMYIYAYVLSNIFDRTFWSQFLRFSH